MADLLETLMRMISDLAAQRPKDAVLVKSTFFLPGAPMKLETEGRTIFLVHRSDIARLAGEVVQWANTAAPVRPLEAGWPMSVAGVPVIDLEHDRGPAVDKVREDIVGCFSRAAPMSAR